MKYQLVRATLIMFREFNTLELTFCVEFIITLLREMLKSSNLSITLFLLMCNVCLWDGGLACMESLSRSDLGNNVCEGGTRPSRPDLGDNVCEGGTHPSRPDLGDNVCELSLIHISSPRDATLSRMPSSA